MIADILRQWQSIAAYRKSIALDSGLLYRPASARKEFDEQEAWLFAELEKTKRKA